MDGIHSNNDKILIIGATNRPNVIDMALRRPGRFEKEIEIPIPNREAREKILTTLLSKVSHSLNKQDIQDIAAITHSYVGADLLSLCREAGIKAWRKLSKLTQSETNIMISREDMINSCSDIIPSAMREVHKNFIIK